MPEPRHAVVTGCSSGIGRAISRRLISDGWRVTGLSRTETALGPFFAWKRVDLGDADDVARVSTGLPSADAFVHAAGLQRTGRLGTLEPEALAEMFAVHVGAASILADRLVPAMPDGARIVLIGSRTAAGAAGKSHYASTKAAVLGLGRSWAKELAPRGITVNVVSPGPTDTPMLADPARADVPPVVPPLGHLVDPEDVAAVVALLVGPHGRSITGQDYVICAGASL
ncbi:SDR family oxidoreductase [Sinomonas sp. ASV486]|uniref:SDR family NAD(P)-dependent oxidoreductase n=1 Tax=Sinomonas sp. ASV486 TaxID=3051170 RepID=UPI0027DE9970|nr:SDR family oxidoreductase [Sinomonas sp. ASV486]MDQ4489424.1 SDR family oxidoreductase [Sinomonas sp. ASV486]